MIQSVNNKKIKEYAKLIQKKERDKTNLFLVEGEHMVKEAFNANALQELFILEGLECPIEFNYETVTQQVLNKLSNQNSNSKMIGVCKKLNLKPEKENNILLLDNVQDPGNVGTILRTAHSFGIDCIYMSKGCADIYNPKTIQSSQGALFYIPVIQTDLVEGIKSKIKCDVDKKTSFKKKILKCMPQLYMTITRTFKILNQVKNTQF